MSAKPKPKKLQKWFDKKYLKKEKKESLKSIDISDKQSKPSDGPLKIEKFTTLTNLEVSNFTSIEFSITDCPQLKRISLSKFTSSLLINNCPELTETKFSDYCIKNLLVGDCPKLTEFDCSRPKLISDAEKLEKLKISNCSELTKVKVSGCHIEELSVSVCPKLTEANLSDCHVEKLSVSNCPKLAKLDCSHTKLTDLDLSNHNFLQELDCSGNKLTELSVSNLTKLNCSSNLIEYLILNLCPEIEDLNCSNNKLKYLEISNCSKLKDLNCSNNKSLKDLDISNCPELEKKIIKDTDLTLTTKKGKTVKNILIVGRTGGGKSTLSNVLSSSEDFNESSSSISITKNFQKKSFKQNGTDYSVIDTMGVGDTKLTKKEVLLKIAEGIYSMPEGISHVLFVVDGRFTADEIETFFAFENALFEAGIVGYVTIVRTKFSNFKNKEACKKDKKQLRDESKKIAGIVSKCKDIFYVDNPPVNININDDDDKEMIEINKKIRKASRNLLFKYLDKVCLEECLKKCHHENYVDVDNKIDENDLKKYLEEHYNDVLNEYSEKHRKKSDLKEPRKKSDLKEYLEKHREDVLNEYLEKHREDVLKEYLEKHCKESDLKEYLEKHREDVLKEYSEKHREDVLKEYLEKHREDVLKEYSEKHCKESDLKGYLEIHCRDNLKKPLEKNGKELEHFLRENCKQKCYYKLKSWDSLREEISFYMDKLGSEDENLEKIMDQIVEIMERRLNPEIPLLFRAFIDIKENCTIS